MKFLESIQTCYTIDSNQSIISLINHDKRLFFDREVSVGDLFLDAVDLEKHEGLQVVTEALHRAVKQNRSICVEYTSFYGDGLNVCVGLIGEWDENGDFCICLHPLEELSKLEGTSNHVTSEKESNIVNLLSSKVISDELKIGIEVYDTQGLLIDINSYNMSLLGVERKEDVLGINLFDNPLFPKIYQKDLLSGKSVYFDVEFETNKINNPRYFRVYVTVLHDDDGNVNRYLLINHDNAELINIPNQWKEISVLNQKLLKTIPLSVVVFDDSGSVGYTNIAYKDIFGGRNNKETKNIFDIHSSFKEHVSTLKDGDKVEFNFEYTATNNELDSDNKKTVYLHAICVPIKTANSSSEAYLAIIKDVSKEYYQAVMCDSILNSMPMAVYIKDMESSKYIFCNNESKRLLNMAENMHTEDVFGDECLEYINKIDLEVFNTAERYLGYDRLVLKTGESMDVNVRGSVIDYGNKQNLLVLLWNDTEISSYKRDSKLLKLIVDEMGSYVWSFEYENINSNKDQMKIDESQADAAIDKFIDIHSDYRQEVAASFFKVLNDGGNLWHAEFKADMTGSGDYTWWETTGVIECIERNGKSYMQVSGISISIESHKQQEQILLDNQTKLNELIRHHNLILNNTNSALVHIDRNYMVVWENLAADSVSKMSGSFQKGEYCYKSAFNLDEPCSDCTMDKVIKSRKAEYSKILLKGKYVVDEYASPVFDSNGEVDGVVLRLNDVTDRENMIKELETAKFKAEESDRLKSAFLANMSHEIRTPLNSIVGFSQLMSDATKQEREEYFNIININSELLLKLINDILDFSKIEAGTVDLKYEEIDLSICFNDIVASVSCSINSSKVKLVIDNPYRECIVTLDKARVTQLLTNYMSNAIKYTAKGSITAGYRLENDGVYMYVKDTGIGISEEKKALAFDRFEKLDEFAQGTGLGLSICKAIVEAMNGKYGLESTQGVGSLFWVFLPISGKNDEMDTIEAEDKGCNS